MALPCGLQCTWDCMHMHMHMHACMHVHPYLPQGVATFHFPCLTDRAWTKTEAASALGRCAYTHHHFDDCVLSTACILYASALTQFVIAAAHYSLLTTHCSLLTPHSSLLPTCSSAAMLDTATLYAGLIVLRRTPAAEAFLQAPRSPEALTVTLTPT